MKSEFSTDKLIYLQIAESIEQDILKAMIEEETQVPSTNQMASMYRINPATAAKGLNMLVSDGILYKKRGIGMFVTTGAVEMIQKKRKTEFYNKFIQPLLNEASNLDLSNEEIINMINKGKEK